MKRARANIVDIFDVSLPIHPEMLAWPTGRRAAVQTVIDQGSDVAPRNSEWCLDSHAGTHIDAALHWLPGGPDVDSIALSACFGPCTVASVSAERSIDSEDLPSEALRPGHRLLLKTENSRFRLGASEFADDFVALTAGAARRLAEAGLALLGIDYLSVESPSGNGEVHRAMLGAGIVLLEAVDLRAVEPGDYHLAALPLRLQGGEASPVRAVLWR